MLPAHGLDIDYWLDATAIPRLGSSDPSLSDIALDGAVQARAAPSTLQRDRAGVARRFDVALAVADDDAARRVDAERARGVENQLRFGLAAVARVVGRVRTDEESRERPEQLVDSPIDGIDLLRA